MLRLELESAVYSWLEKGGEIVGVGDLSDRIEFAWNKRWTVTAGSAIWKFKEEEGIITLGEKLMEAATPQQRQQTIVHEVCHILADVKYNRRCMHNPGWKLTMKALGFKPEIYHRIKIPTPYRKNEIFCPSCLNRAFVNQDMAVDIAEGKFRCGICKNSDLKVKSLVLSLKG